MIPVGTQNNWDAGNPVYKQRNRYPSYEIGCLRRAKMHAAQLIESIDRKKILPPALHQLLEISLILETTDSKILATYLKRPPAAIRTDFQKICTSLGAHRKFFKNFHCKEAVKN